MRQIARGLCALLLVGGVIALALFAPGGALHDEFMAWLGREEPAAEIPPPVLPEGWEVLHYWVDPSINRIRITIAYDYESIAEEAWIEGFLAVLDWGLKYLSPVEQTGDYLPFFVIEVCYLETGMDISGQEYKVARKEALFVLYDYEVQAMLLAAERAGWASASDLVEFIFACPSTWPVLLNEDVWAPPEGDQWQYGSECEDYEVYQEIYWDFLESYAAYCDAKGIPSDLTFE